ncbi:MAG: phosphoglycerate kinase [Solirubrobacteraceae bacterium]|nr:phosphoglycerate kinase [Solirubrobacteraceae bacterium]
MAEHRQIRFASPPGSARLLLIRHGESAAFEEDRPFALVDGHGDPPLRDPDGLEQARRIGERLGGEDIAAIYVTPLQRTA